MQSLDILRDLIRIDTQNPPGNEAPAVEYIEALCREAGLEYETRTYDGNRANILVRLAPQRDDRLIILGHLDVVKADPAAWDHEPFAAEIDDGYLYGRGALDMKYFVAVALAVLVALKPEEDRLERGITCVFTADEENGSARGLPRLLDEPDIRRELTGRTVLNEGGGFAWEHGGRWYSLVETGQKSVCRLKVTVPELAGSSPYFPTLEHESILARAVAAVSSVELDDRTPQTVSRLLERVGGAGAADAYARTEGTVVGPDPDDAAAKAAFLGDPFFSKLLGAMTRSMVTPTIVHGGARNPELPRGVKGEAVFDCRLLPDVDEETFVAAVRAALADLPVELEVLSFSAGYETEFSNPIIGIAEAALKRHDPRIEACVPFLTPGANDGKYLRPLGCEVLGFAPLSTSQPFAEVITGIHGVDERISLESVSFCTDVMSDLCRRYVTRKDTHVRE
ncbi:MAG: M20/M25/M40 family metallo-hydrolase [Spirochaetota bacterium]